MTRILKLKGHNSKKEIEFELKFLKSLSVKERFNLMFRKTKELVMLLEKNGHGKSFKIDLIKMKRAAGRPRDLEDLAYLKKLVKL